MIKESIDMENARVIQWNKDATKILASAKYWGDSGVFILRTEDLKAKEFLSTGNSATVRDIKLSQSGEQILTGGLDKQLQICSLRTKNIVMKYQCPSPIWSVSWGYEDDCLCMCGMQNGKVRIYDLRNTSVHLQHLEEPEAKRMLPIHSLQAIQNGVISGSLARVGICNTDDNWASFAFTRMDFNEGCSSLCFDQQLTHMSCSVRGHHAMNHIFEMKEDAFVPITKLGGHLNQTTLSRSWLGHVQVDQQNPSLYLFSPSERSKNIYMWNVERQELVDKLEPEGNSCILDVAVSNKICASVSKDKLSLFQVLNDTSVCSLDRVIG